MLKFFTYSVLVNKDVQSLHRRQILAVQKHRWCCPWIIDIVLVRYLHRSAKRTHGRQHLSTKILPTPWHLIPPLVNLTITLLSISYRGYLGNLPITLLSTSYKDYVVNLPITLLFISYQCYLVNLPITVLSISYRGYLVNLPITLLSIFYWGYLVNLPITLLSISYRGWWICLSLYFLFPIGVMRLSTVRYLSHFITRTKKSAIWAFGCISPVMLLYIPFVNFSLYMCHQL
jgi:hypothetical protein